MIMILLAEDHNIVRNGIKSVLEKERLYPGYGRSG
jgi:DNA-binding NarL/FixJ family response regulator